MPVKPEHRVFGALTATTTVSSPLNLGMGLSPRLRSASFSGLKRHITFTPHSPHSAASTITETETKQSRDAPGQTAASLRVHTVQTRSIRPETVTESRRECTRSPQRVKLWARSPSLHQDTDCLSEHSHLTQVHPGPPSRKEPWDMEFSLKLIGLFMFYMRRSKYHMKDDLKMAFTIFRKIQKHISASPERKRWR